MSKNKGGSKDLKFGEAVPGGLDPASKESNAELGRVAAKVRVANELKFAPSTFGQKKSKPTTPETLQALTELHKEMSAGGLVSKTAYCVEAHKRGYTTREIADVLGMKPAIVYSLIWRITSKVPKGPTPAADSVDSDEDLIAE